MSDIVFDRMLLDYLEKKNDQSTRIAAMESEIARLRLTNEEREAVETAVRWMEPYQQVAATLRKLLERLHT
jgi:hypothetical protein